MKMTIISTTTLFHFRSSPATASPPPPSIFPFPTGDVRCGTKLNNFQSRAVSKPRTQEYVDILQQKVLPLIDWQPDIVKDNVEQEDITLTPKILYPTDEIKRYVETIKGMLGSMSDGDITVSAYDTAWVAMVPDVNGTGRPQFPSSLQWIVNNQLSDGSWGDQKIFLAHDRLINTLACVIALTSWNIHPNKCQKGMKFVNENIHKLEDENDIHMPIGFEVAFPSLIDTARKLNIKVPEESPFLNAIYAKRNLKLKKIPKEIMHKVATTLLHSLEGMPDLEWEKLLKLQCKDGSFLFSPSSTAFALMQTKDDRCLAYLTNVVTKFNGGVPNVYPVDMFEHIWVVDRLQRLGISRYFKTEIKDCVDYIYRYFTEKGICWARNTNVQDIDDTAMGFRLLRLHGYKISPDVFRQFENDGKFVCFAGQSTQAVTGMFNLLRASQVLFPGEKILKDAMKFSFNDLKKKQSKNEIFDKWIIAKDLPGEVRFALEVPWYASLPRLETRYYLEQYGGEDDVWIGKTLYRMGKVSNNTYLEMAKLDYNNSLAMHKHEWNNMQQWYVDFDINGLGTSDIRSLLVSYYLAAASVFEPERSIERTSWAKTTILAETISSFFVKGRLSRDHRRAFVDEFRNTRGSLLRTQHPKPWHRLMGVLQGTLNELSLDSLMVRGQDIHPQLHDAWGTWLLRWQERDDVADGQAELIVQTINAVAGRWVSKDLLSHSQYRQLVSVTNTICHQISHLHSYKDTCTMGFKSGTKETVINSKMQELVQLVFSDALNKLDRDIKEAFLAVAKTFYYKAYCDAEMINVHISKVLFESVV